MNIHHFRGGVGRNSNYGIYTDNINKQNKFSFVWYTLAFVCWWFVLSAFAAFIAYSLQIFVTSLQTRSAQIGTAKNWLRMVCFNDTMVVSLGSTVDCARNLRESEMNAWLWAFFDVMSTWNICGTYGCEKVITQGIGHFQRLGIFLFGVVVFVFFFTRSKIIKMRKKRFALKYDTQTKSDNNSNLQHITIGDTTHKTPTAKHLLQNR